MPALAKAVALVWRRCGVIMASLSSETRSQAPAGTVVDDAAELEVEEFRDPQAGSAQHQQTGPGEPIGQVGDGCHQPGVDVRGEALGSGRARGSTPRLATASIITYYPVSIKRPRVRAPAA